MTRMNASIVSGDFFENNYSLFRKNLKAFIAQEITPFYDQWEKDGIIPRTAWKKMGESGYLCPWIEKEYGGMGLCPEHSFVITEELAYAGLHSFLVGMHNDVVAPYIYSFGDEEQKRRWLPGCVSGDIILAIAMTEPDAGSDLASMTTKATKNGQNYIINGEKIYISNGINANLIVVACRTGERHGSPYDDISLICVEEGSHGFSRGRKLVKTGWHSQDTAELVFQECKVPVSNLLGDEGKGFYYMMKKLQQERLVSTIAAQAAAEGAFQSTLEYIKKGKTALKTFGNDYIDTVLIVELATDIEIGRCFLNNLINDHVKGEDVLKKVSMAKWWISDMANRVLSSCMDLYRDYGYLEGYPIARLFRDIRPYTIFAGTNEIMKKIIGKTLGL